MTVDVEKAGVAMQSLLLFSFMHFFTEERFEIRLLLTRAGVRMKEKASSSNRILPMQVGCRWADAYVVDDRSFLSDLPDVVVVVVKHKKPAASEGRVIIESDRRKSSRFQRIIALKLSSFGEIFDPGLSER